MTTNARLKEALTGGSNVKEKAGPPVADGVLTPTPDSAEVLEWRSKSGTDCAGTSSTYLDEDDDGAARRELIFGGAHTLRRRSRRSRRAHAPRPPPRRTPQASSRTSCSGSSTGR